MDLLNLDGRQRNPFGKQARKRSTTPNKSSGGSSGPSFRIGLGLVQGNPDTVEQTAEGSLIKLATHFGGMQSRGFLDAIAGIYSQLTGGYNAKPSAAFNAVRSAMNQAATSGMTLADAIRINGSASKSGTWSAFSNNRSAANPPTVDFGSLAGLSGNYAGISDMSSQAQISAYANVLSTLHNWNLDSLTDKAWEMISNPGFHLNAGQVVDALRNTPEYQAAFPGMAEIRAKGLNLSESQYVGREADILDQFAQNNVPQGMLTKDQLGKMVAGGIYGTNLQNRLIKGYEAVKNADPMVKQMLQKWYGVQPGHLLGYMLSPDHGMQQIVKEVQAANIKTESHLAGFKGLDRKTAQELSKQMSSSGYGMDYFRTGFGKAAALQPLQEGQVGIDNQATASKKQILGATFTGLRGSTPNATQAVQLATQARTAGLQGGGGYIASEKGVEGAGSAPT